MSFGLYTPRNVARVLSVFESINEAVKETDLLEKYESYPD